MVCESPEQALGLRPRMQGRVGRGLALTSYPGHGDLAPFFLSILADLERSCCLVIGGSSFTPRGERHVHHNHVVRAVRLIGVDG